MKYIRVGFRNIARDNVTTEMCTALLASISFKVCTDDTLTVFGVPADANITGTRFGKVKSRLNQKPYAFLQTIGSSTTGGISSLTVIDNMLYAFAYASEEEPTTGKRYDIDSDGLLTYKDTFESNLGHQNTVDYSPENQALVSIRATMAIPDFDIYIFEHVDGSTVSFDISADNAIKYDMSEVSGIGDKALNAIWGFDDFGKNDILLVFTRNDTLRKRYVTVMQLGKGSNELVNGTYISGKESNEFNGTFGILYTIEREYVSGENCNDMCFYNNEIYELSTQIQIGIKLFIHRFEDFNTSIDTKRVLIERRNAQGSGVDREYEGIAIYNGRMYIGSTGTGIYVFNAP